MSALAVFSPAKINLFLSITGRRPDEFHDLVSVVATLDYGDTLWATPRDDAEFTLECDQPEVPTDQTNLILRAAKAWREAAGETAHARGVHFVLEKRIPMGAGLGGGSGNAVAALQALNAHASRPLADDVIARIAASLGSDCPLFVDGGPLIMRGRGERLEKLPPTAAARLRGRRVLLFKPPFGISTVWAYQQMAAAAPDSYLSPSATEQRLAAWVHTAQAPAEQLLFNNMEAPAFRKYLALPTLLDQLRAEFGLAVGMSGSGSACFALVGQETPVAEVVARIRAAWGEEVFVAEAKIR